MQLNWYEVQKSMEAREAEIARSAEVRRLFRQARETREATRASLGVLDRNRTGPLRVALGRLLISWGSTLASTPAASAAGADGSTPSL